MIHHIRKFLAASALATLPFAALAGDRTVDFAKGDPVMAEAVAAARESLPAFLAHAFSADGTALREAQLKVAIPMTDAHGDENIWVEGLTRTGEAQFTGRLANEPNYLGALHLGSEVGFTSDQIRDWGLSDRTTGKLYGHYTTRVVIEHLEPEIRSRIEDRLAKPPLPKGW